MPVIGQPRIKKRYDYFLKKGCEVYIFTFSRNIALRLNKLGPEYDQFRQENRLHVIDLGTIQNGKYLHRIPVMGMAAVKILKTYRQQINQSDLIYICGHDLAIALSRFFRGRKKVAEIADVIYLDRKNQWITRFMRRIERRLFPKYFRIVLTSEGFLHYYNEFIENFDNYLLIPNKLSPDIRQIAAQPKTLCDKIRIGYVGYVRYPISTLAFLRKIAQLPDRFEFHIFGDCLFMDQVDEIRNQSSNIFYHGTFRNPDDLPAIYAKIDLTYAVYLDGKNEQIAEPNKFYESLYFDTPIVAQEDTFLASQVRKFDSGFVVDANDEQNLDRFLDVLNPESIAEKVAKVAALDKQAFIEDEGGFEELFALAVQPDHQKSESGGPMTPAKP